MPLLVLIYIFLTTAAIITLISAIKVYRLIRLWRSRQNLPSEQRLLSTTSLFGHEIDNRAVVHLLGLAFPISVTVAWLAMGVFLLVFCSLLLAFQPLSWPNLEIFLLSTFAPASQLIIIGFSVYSAWFTLYFYGLSNNHLLPLKRRTGFIIGHTVVTLTVILYTLGLMSLPLFHPNPADLSVLLDILFGLNQFFYLTILLKMGSALWVFSRKFYANDLSRRMSLARALRAIYVFHWVVCSIMLAFEVIWAVSFFTKGDTGIPTLLSLYIGDLLMGVGVAVSLSTIADREEIEDVDAVMYFPIDFFWFPCLSMIRARTKRTYQLEEEAEENSLIGYAKPYDDWGDE